MACSASLSRSSRIAISAYVVSRTGRAEDFFLPGLVANAGYALAYAVSIAVRWPLLGVFIAIASTRGMEWRQEPARVQAYSRASWVWVALFSLRLAVQLPLYLTGAVVGIWLSWLILRARQRDWSRSDRAVRRTWAERETLSRTLPDAEASHSMDYRDMLDIAVREARSGLREGGIPIGSALFDASGAVVGTGHNQRLQRADPSAHAEVEAFRNAGRRRSYRDTTISTTLAPCWLCSGLIRQFGISTVVVGESRTFRGGIDWLRECGVHVIDCESDECIALLQSFIAEQPETWGEDIGE